MWSLPGSVTWCVALVPAVAQKHSALCGTENRLQRPLAAQPLQTSVEPRGGKLIFLSNPLWLLSLMEHSLTVNFTISPEGKMSLLCFCKEPGRRIHRRQVPLASSWRVGSGACIRWSGTQPGLQTCRGRQRTDRSLISVLALGTNVRNIIPAAAKGLPAVHPG